MQIRSFAHGAVDAKLSNKCTHNCSLHKYRFVFESVIVVLVVLFCMFPSFHSFAYRVSEGLASAGSRCDSSGVCLQWPGCQE